MLSAIPIGNTPVAFIVAERSGPYTSMCTLHIGCAPYAICGHADTYTIAALAEGRFFLRKNIELRSATLTYLSILP